MVFLPIKGFIINFCFIFEYRCNSALGRDISRKFSKGKRSFQRISLEHNPPPKGTCVHKGVVIHELLHALGFYHEQSRLDRDDYIEIFEKNIKQGMRHQLFGMSSFVFVSTEINK